MTIECVEHMVSLVGSCLEHHKPDIRFQVHTSYTCVILSFDVTMQSAIQGHRNTVTVMSVSTN